MPPIKLTLESFEDVAGYPGKVFYVLHEYPGTGCPQVPYIAIDKTESGAFKIRQLNRTPVKEFKDAKYNYDWPRDPRLQCANDDIEEFAPSEILPPTNGGNPLMPVIQEVRSIDLDFFQKNKNTQGLVVSNDGCGIDKNGAENSRPVVMHDSDPRRVIWKGTPQSSKAFVSPVQDTSITNSVADHDASTSRSSLPIIVAGSAASLTTAEWKGTEFIDELKQTKSSVDHKASSSKNRLGGADEVASSQKTSSSELMDTQVDNAPKHTGASVYSNSCTLPKLSSLLEESTVQDKSTVVPNASSSKTASTVIVDVREPYEKTGGAESMDVELGNALQQTNSMIDPKACCSSQDTLPVSVTVSSTSTKTGSVESVGLNSLRGQNASNSLLVASCDSELNVSPTDDERPTGTSAAFAATVYTKDGVSANSDDLNSIPEEVAPQGDTNTVLIKEISNIISGILTEHAISSTQSSECSTPPPTTVDDFGTSKLETKSVTQEMPKERDIVPVKAVEEDQTSENVVKEISSLVSGIISKHKKSLDRSASKNDPKKSREVRDQADIPDKCPLKKSKETQHLPKVERELSNVDKLISKARNFVKQKRIEILEFEDQPAMKQNRGSSIGSRSKEAKDKTQTSKSDKAHRKSSTSASTPESKDDPGPSKARTDVYDFTDEYVVEPDRKTKTVSKRRSTVDGSENRFKVRAKRHSSKNLPYDLQKYRKELAKNRPSRKQPKIIEAQKSTEKPDNQKSTTTRSRSCPGSPVSSPINVASNVPQNKPDKVKASDIKPVEDSIVGSEGSLSSYAEPTVSKTPNLVQKKKERTAKMLQLLQRRTSTSENKCADKGDSGTSPKPVTPKVGERSSKLQIVGMHRLPAMVSSRTQIKSIMKKQSKSGSSDSRSKEKSQCSKKVGMKCGDDVETICRNSELVKDGNAKDAGKASKVESEKEQLESKEPVTETRKVQLELNRQKKIESSTGSSSFANNSGVFKTSEAAISGNDVAAALPKTTSTAPAVVTVSNVPSDCPLYSDLQVPSKSMNTDESVKSTKRIVDLSKSRPNDEKIEKTEMKNKTESVKVSRKGSKDTSGDEGKNTVKRSSKVVDGSGQISPTVKVGPVMSKDAPLSDLGLSLAEKPAATIEKPVAASVKPGTADKKHASIGEKPATASKKHAAALEKPAAASEKPATAIEKPAAASEKPVAASVKPGTADKKHAAISEIPATTSKKHAAAIEKPAAASEKPATAIEKPVAASVKPGTADKKHAAIGTIPATASKKYAAAIEKPAAASEKPAAASEKPIAASVKPGTSDKKHAAIGAIPATASKKHASAIEKPAAASEKLAAASEKPATADKKHAAIAEKPATAIKKHAAAIEKPAAASEKPATAIEKPASASENPAAASVKPGTADKKHAAIGEKPATAIKKHAAAIEKPAAASEKPATAIEKPASASENPAAASVKPGTADKKHAAIGEKPATAIKKHAAAIEKPTAASEKPAAASKKHAAAGGKPASLSGDGTSQTVGNEDENVVKRSSGACEKSKPVPPTVNTSRLAAEDGPLADLSSPVVAADSEKPAALTVDIRDTVPISKVLTNLSPLVAEVYSDSSDELPTTESRKQLLRELTSKLPEKNSSPFGDSLNEAIAHKGLLGLVGIGSSNIIENKIKNVVEGIVKVKIEIQENEEKKKPRPLEPPTAEELGEFFSEIFYNDAPETEKDESTTNLSAVSNTLDKSTAALAVPVGPSDNIHKTTPDNLDVHKDVNLDGEKNAENHQKTTGIPRDQSVPSAINPCVALHNRQPSVPQVASGSGSIVPNEPLDDDVVEISSQQSVPEIVDVDAIVPSSHKSTEIVDVEDKGSPTERSGRKPARKRRRFVECERFPSVVTLTKDRTVRGNRLAALQKLVAMRFSVEPFSPKGRSVRSGRLKSCRKPTEPVVTEPAVDAGESKVTKPADAAAKPEVTKPAVNDEEPVIKPSIGVIDISVDPVPQSTAVVESREEPVTNLEDEAYPPNKALLPDLLSLPRPTVSIRKTTFDDDDDVIITGVTTITGKSLLNAGASTSKSNRSSNKRSSVGESGPKKLKKPCLIRCPILLPVDSSPLGPVNAKSRLMKTLDPAMPQSIMEFQNSPIREPATLGSPPIPTTEQNKAPNTSETLSAKSSSSSAPKRSSDLNDELPPSPVPCNPLTTTSPAPPTSTEQDKVPDISATSSAEPSNSSAQKLSSRLSDQLQEVPSTSRNDNAAQDRLHWGTPWTDKLDGWRTEVEVKKGVNRYYWAGVDKVWAESEQSSVGTEHNPSSVYKKVDLQYQTGVDQFWAEGEQSSVGTEHNPSSLYKKVDLQHQTGVDQFWVGSEQSSVGTEHNPSSVYKTSRKDVQIQQRGPRRKRRRRARWMKRIQDEAGSPSTPQQLSQIYRSHIEGDGTGGEAVLENVQRHRDKMYTTTPAQTRGGRGREDTAPEPNTQMIRNPQLEEAAFRTRTDGGRSILDSRLKTFTQTETTTSNSSKRYRGKWNGRRGSPHSSRASKEPEEPTIYTKKLKLSTGQAKGRSEGPQDGGVRKERLSTQKKSPGSGRGRGDKRKTGDGPSRPTLRSGVRTTRSGLIRRGNS